MTTVKGDSRETQHALDPRPDEIMTISASRLLEDGKVMFAGIGQPLVAAALARRRQAPSLTVILEGGMVGIHLMPGELPDSTNEMRAAIGAEMLTSATDIFLMAQRGFFDYGFLGVAQIDMFGNVNTSLIGDPDRPSVRLPGPGGANDIISMCNETVIVTNHETRRFVERVDWVTSPGYLTGGDSRREAGLRHGGPSRVVTDLAILDFEEETHRMRLRSLQPGVTVDQVVAATGFELVVPEDVDVLEPVTKPELRLLRHLNGEPEHAHLRRVETDVANEQTLGTDLGELIEPTSFEFQRADSWDEAVELLRIWDGEAKIIAGGQSIVPMLNLRLTMPSALIDINDIGDEGGPRLEDGDDGPVVVVPALSTHTTVLGSSVIAEHCPMLHRAVGLVGNVRVRNRGTFGGSVAHADPTGEIPCCVLAMGGTVTLRGPRGTRTVPATEWFRTYLTTAAEPDELVTEVRIPSAAGGAWAFEEEVRRFSDFATVSVALQTRPGVVPAIVLGGVADRPVLVPDDVVDPLSNPEAEILAAVAESAARSVHPETDVHASGEHRRRLVRVLVRRALVHALRPDGSRGDL